MLVNLTYFRATGKYSGSGSYQTKLGMLWEIWKEVETLAHLKTLPGLMKGHSNYHILIDVPNHPHRHPHLLLGNDIC